MNLKECDNKMITDYQTTYSSLKSRKDEIINLQIALKKIENDPQYNDLRFIFEDINFMFETFEMLVIACENRNGVKQDFFNLTTFNRASMSTTIIIFLKLKELLKKHEDFSIDIIEYLSKIQN